MLSWLNPRFTRYDGLSSRSTGGDHRGSGLKGAVLVGAQLSHLSPILAFRGISLANGGDNYILDTFLQLAVAKMVNSVVFEKQRQPFIFPQAVRVKGAIGIDTKIGAGKKMLQLSSSGLTLQSMF